MARKRVYPDKGQRFNSLTFLKEAAPDSKTNHSTGLFLCVCGQKKVLKIARVKAGDNISCGCVVNSSRKHGEAGTPTYRSYKAMLRRCYDTEHVSYERYGGRGIRVCKRWRKGENGKLGIECFIADMGLRPDGKTLDRKDPDKDYRPSNCKWASPKRQSNNRRNTVKINIEGKKRPLSFWARRSSVSLSTVRRRLARGVDPKEALELT